MFPLKTMSNSVMMQPFPEFPQLPQVPSQTLPEITLERRVFMLGKYVERLENDFSQRFFDLEGQTERLKKQMDFIQEQNEYILSEQIQLSTRIELVRRTAGEHERKHAVTKEELDEIYEDMKIREQSVASYREAVVEVTEYCSHVEKDAHNLRYEMKDLNVVVEDLSKDLKINKEAVDQIYLKNNRHAYLLGIAMERMDDIENGVKNIRNACLESVREAKEITQEPKEIPLQEACFKNDVYVDSDDDSMIESILKNNVEYQELLIAPSLSSEIYERHFPSL